MTSYLPFRAVFSRKLNCGLICFGAGVGKKDLARERVIDYRLRNQRLRLGIVIVRDVHKLRRLFSDRLGHDGMAMAYARYRPSREKIQVLISFYIPGDRAFGPVQA